MFLSEKGKFFGKILGEEAVYRRSNRDRSEVEGGEVSFSFWNEMQVGVTKIQGGFGVG